MTDPALQDLRESEIVNGGQHVESWQSARREPGTQRGLVLTPCRDRKQGDEDGAKPPIHGATLPPGGRGW